MTSATESKQFFEETYHSVPFIQRGDSLVLISIRLWYESGPLRAHLDKGSLIVDIGSSFALLNSFGGYKT